MNLSLESSLGARRAAGGALLGFFADGADGLLLDLTKTDGRNFQTSLGVGAVSAIADPIGLALDTHAWAGKTLAQVMAAQPDIVINGGFAADTNWVKSAGATISGGLFNCNVAAFALTSQAYALETGALYRVSYSIVAYTSGSVRVNFGGGAQSNGTVQSSVGDYVDYIAPVSGNNSIWIQAAGSGFVGSVDNVSIKKVPSNYGRQSTTGARPTLQTTGARFDASDDNLLTNYLALAGANCMVARVTVPASLAGTQIIAGASGTNVNRFQIGINATGRLCAGVGSDATTTIVGTNDLRGQTLVVGLSLDGSTVRLFEGAAQIYEAAQGSTPTTSVPLRIGALNNDGVAGSSFGGDIARLVVGRKALTLSDYLRIRAEL
ncbi:MAG: hypothetical protein ACAH27_05660 [Xanthobacteraceae bacterium]